MIKELLEVKKVNLAQIPCLFIRSFQPTRGLPTIFLYHGWSSKKANYEFMGKVLALHGYQVLIPDALDHGERGSLDYENLGVMEEHFWQVVISSVNEFNLILTEGEKDLGIDPNHLAVMGSSMGGMIASSIFARYKKVRTVINMNGACAWQDAEERVKESRGVNRVASIGVEILNQYDPFQLKDNLYPRPILLQHGESDSSIPVETQEYFYNQMLDIYKEKPDNIKLSIVKNLNHHKTIGMLEEVIDWLNNWLKMVNKLPQ